MIYYILELMIQMPLPFCRNMGLEQKVDHKISHPKSPKEGFQEFLEGVGGIWAYDLHTLGHCRKSVSGKQKLSF